MRSRLHAALLATVVSLGTLLLPSAPAAQAQPTTVSVPGSFGSEVGCAGDWDPGCSQVQLVRGTDDDVWSTVLWLPEGSYEYKAALNGTWDVNYGLHAVQGGDVIPLTVPPGGASVKLYYDDTTHWVTDSTGTTVVTAAGSFQSELGCPGDWAPDCLRSWLEDPDGDGTSTFTTTALPAGDYEVKAALGETWDVNYGAGGAPNGSNILFHVPTTGSAVTFSFDGATHVLTVTTQPTQQATSVTVTSSANPSLVGQQVTYTATVSPEPGGGTVDFTDGGTSIDGCGAVAVGTTGTATCETTYSAVGTRTIAATYSGDDASASSASGPLSQQVGYGTRLRYDASKSNRAGSTVPVKVQLVDATGTNVSAPGTTLTVTGFSPSPAPGTAPSGTFTSMTSAQGAYYQLNVRTTRYPKARYQLSFTATGDPTVHTATVVVG
ncbi:pullulanase X25 domain-containing protein [Nocardioides marmoribigeumensis]|uniref:Ig-like domain repeat protein n=1 Tax=Nocardioides marmoribigeumensis TaxID=433649 RepID=A0ABU2BR06_9ACTN|nr:Ig-like domain repeat protein [Nocardioides marmoribigeumensis]MDR7361038.1 hypothetical protein [Nocardioides marmoribigeumensis]